MSKPYLLLVDGDAKGSRLLEVSLRRAGYALGSATSGAQALTNVTARPPDLIILAENLPDIDGLDLVRRIKASPEAAELPILLLTSDITPEKKVLGLELGVEGYITRPIYVQEVLTRVRLALQHAERERMKRGATSAMSAGALTNMAVMDLAQMVETSGKSGVIKIDSADGHHGALYFHNGVVIDAEVGAIVGEDAVYRMLLWNEGNFQVEFKSIRRPERIRTSRQTLLLEAVRRVDEWEQLAERLPPLASVFEVDFRRAAELLDGLSEETRGILRLFDGKRTLAAVVEEAELPDLVALALMEQLIANSVVGDTGRRGTVPSSRTRKVTPWIPAQAQDEPARARETNRPKPARVKTQPPPPILSPALPAPVVTAPLSAAPAMAVAEVIPFRRAETQAFVPIPTPAAPTPPPPRPKTNPGVPAAPRPTEPMPQYSGELSSSVGTAKDPSENTLLGIIPPASPAPPPQVFPKTLQPMSPIPDLAPFPKTVGRAPTPPPTPIPFHPAPSVPPQPRVATVPPVQPAAPASEHTPSTEMRFFTAPPQGEGDSYTRLTSELSTVMKRPPVSRKQKIIIVTAATALVGGAIGAYVLVNDPYLGKGRLVLREPTQASDPRPALEPSPSPSPSASPSPNPSTSTLAESYETVLGAARDHWKRGRKKKAQEAASQALEINPEGDGAMSLLAVLYLDGGKLAKAKDLASLALSVNDNNAEAHFALGVALQEFGQSREAKEHYRRYVELEPKGKYAADARAMMR